MPGTELGKAYVQIIPSAQGIQNSIADVLEPEADNAGKKAGSKLSKSIGGALKVSLGASVAAIGTASAAAADMAKNAVSSYAEYEQLAGGVEKLYGEASQKLKDYADEAYATAGMSANAYMETATSFSAALVNSLSGDVDKAADMTDVAMRAISDNVNVFGSDFESVQNAFMGFAKQNYTMLDNLKLGYGGTKSEMERLIADANEWGAANGQASNLSIESFADVITAIQQIQEMQNISGTTAKEAMSTIEGSANATKAAWQNVVTAIGRGEGMEDAFDGLISSIFGENEGEGLINQIAPRIQESIEGIADFVTKAAPSVAEKLPELVEDIAPSLLQTGSALAGTVIETILTTLPALFPVLVEQGIEIITQFANAVAESAPVMIPAATDAIIAMTMGLIDNIPMLIEAALEMISGLAEGLIAAIPKIIEAIPDIIAGLTNGLLEAIPMLIETGVELLVSLVEDLPDIITGIVNAIPLIIDSIVSVLDTLIPKLVDAGIELFVALVENMPAIIAGIIEAVPKIIESLVKAFGNLNDKMSQAGKDLMAGLAQGILDGVGKVIEKAKEAAGDILSAVKGFFGIASPSKVFRYQIGEMIPEGIALGIRSKMDMVEAEILDPLNQSLADAQKDIHKYSRTQDAPDALKRDTDPDGRQDVKVDVDVNVSADEEKWLKVTAKANQRESRRTRYNNLSNTKVR